MSSVPCQLSFLILIASLPATLYAESGLDLYARIANHAQTGECVDVDIDMQAVPGLVVDGQKLTYPMAFNNVAEGWSWQPGSNPDHEDYYRYKYLPLGSTEEEHGEYRAENKIGEMQTMKIRWRYDYFLAFDNLYDFYQREPNDDAGFSSHQPAATGHLPLANAADTAMHARVCLEAPLTSESTTFWKATHARPVDFTLKKRYLIGKLQAIDFVDRRSGAIVNTVTPQPKAAQ